MKNKIGKHPALFLFKRNIFWWQKIDLKKRRRKADSVKHSESDKYVDSDKQSEVDSITLEKRGNFSFFILLFISSICLLKSRNLQFIRKKFPIS